MVRLEIFDREVAGGVFRADGLVLEDEVADAVDALLELAAVVDVDMAAQAGVALLIDLDDGVEKGGNALAVAAHRRADRDTEQVAQLLRVDLVALGLELVVHVQGHDGPQVHVDELGRQVEVALDVGRVDDIDDDVGHGVDEVLPDIEFLRRIGREGVGAGEVDEGDVVTLVGEVAFLGVHRHAAVVADVFMAAGGDVEKGGLAAVGVADEGHADDVAALLGDMGQGLVEELPVHLVGAGRMLEALEVLVGVERLRGLGLGHDINILRFGAPQGDLVAQHLVFDRVLQRSTEHTAHALSADEPHLYQAFAEAAVAVDAHDDAALARLEICQ